MNNINYKSVRLIIFSVVIIILINLSNFSYSSAIESKIIKVVMDDNYPPFSFKDNNGKLQGITIEQWKLFEKKSGLKVEITGQDWNKAYQAMLDGKFDVIDTISYNKDREKILDFTKPYATIDVPIFFHKNISGITGIESLKGFSVAAKKGDNAINELKKNGITHIIEYNSAEDLIKAAKNQEIVVFVMGKPPALHYMYKMGIENDFKYSSSLLYTSKFYRAVKKGDAELLFVLNKGFSKISNSEYKEIDKKWYGNSAPSFYNSEFFKNILIIISIISMIILLLLLWNGTLRMKVRKKVKELSLTVEELKASEARVCALLEAIPDMFFLFNGKGEIIDFHTLQEDKLFISPDQFLNKSVTEVFPEKLSKKFIFSINNALLTEDTQTTEYELEMNTITYEYEARLVACGKDRVIGIVRDITERKKAEEKLLEISIHDSLTGVYNRYYFENEIIKLQSREIKSLFVAIFDLDGLKLINDTMGHNAGDNYLKTSAQIIINAFPASSIISRIGGDEFSILIPDKTKVEIQKYISSFNENIEKFNQGNQIIQLSISIGYAFNEGENINIHEMITEADNRMYRVKLHRNKSMKSEIVQTMKNLLEARDFITEGHANRMEELAVNLAMAVGMSEKDISDIRLLAQFHDIGKVGIPDAILFKSSKLTTEEFEIMKRHTDIGHRIAEASVDLLPIADFILKHHEFWDGKGYPFGIKGTEIPIECRILSIVDAYDAMTNDRPYRKALSKETALLELKRCGGTQFDSNLVDDFIELMN